MNLPPTETREEPPTDDICWELSYKCPCGASGVKATDKKLHCELCKRVWERYEL